jgi:chorismate mutase/prephenate dehydratase
LIRDTLPQCRESLIMEPSIMTAEATHIERLRAALEAADNALGDALDARARAVQALGEFKLNAPDAYFTLRRDHEVIARMLERVQVFPKSAVRSVMTEVLSACTQMIAPVDIVYVGQEGGFGNLAARRQFGESANLRSVDSAELALSEIERGRASYAILPFETSNDGAVTASLNLLARSDAKICGEIRVARTFHLISQPGTRDAVRKIYASAGAIAACESFLRQHFPQALIVDVRSGIIAAQHAKDDPEAAALATELVAEGAGLTYVERSIEDSSDLETRYVTVGNDFPPRSGRDRTAIALALHDAPGVLIDCLQPFADRKLNIFRLETRPARGWAFRYLILLEVDGHVTDRPVVSAIEHLRTSSRYVKVLGSYPISGE